MERIRPDPEQELCAHIVDRSNGVANEEDQRVKVIRTPRSFASFFNG